MNRFQHIFSEKGILAATAVTLVFAAALVIIGFDLEVTDLRAGVPSAFTGNETVTWYLTAGVMGDVSSTAGTLQSLGFFMAYVFTPFMAALMFAIKASFQEQDAEAVHAA